MSVILIHILTLSKKMNVDMTKATDVLNNSIVRAKKYARLMGMTDAVEENDKVLIVLGSENKVDMLRNPYDISLREEMLRECLTDEDNKKLEIVTLPDWSMESDKENDKTWGRYFYYNVVSRIFQKRFSLYYSDDPKILDDWFNDTEVKEFITYRNFERSKLFEGLSSTKIRNAFINDDVDYIKEYCPESVQKRFDYLKKYYENVTLNPKDDFSME